MSDTAQKWIKVFDMPDGNQVLYVNAGMHLSTMDANGKGMSEPKIEYSIQISVKINGSLLTKVKAFPFEEVAEHYFNRADQAAARSVYMDAEKYLTERDKLISNGQQ